MQCCTKEMHKRILVLGYLQSIALCSTKIRIFCNFVQILNKIAAKISRSLVMVALRNLHYKRLLLLGEVSSCLRNTTPVFRQRRENNTFFATTGQNHSCFTAFAKKHSILTDKNRQAKPGRFQIKSLKKISSYTFLHSRNGTENMYFHLELSQFCDVSNGFNSIVRRCSFSADWGFFNNYF